MIFFETNLQSLKLPDTSTEFSLGIPKAVISLTDQNLVKFQVHKDKANLTIGESNPYIKFSMEDVQLEFEMKYRLYSNPEWIKD